MNVDKHISELLYDHDCVIVPDFGGFVANYAPAKVHPVQHSFSPPSKNIVFNRNLRNNDGLLANHISSAAETSYPEALRYISNFVDEAGAQLKKGQKVKIIDVGTLFLDVEKNIQFEPDKNVNHLRDAFGLTEFQSPAIRRDNGIQRIEKEFRDRKAIPAARKKINIKRVIALTIAAPLIAAMIWIPLKTDILKDFNYASLNPFAKNEVHRPEAKVIPVPAETTVIPAEHDTISANVPEVVPEVLHTAAEAVKADSTSVAVTSPVNAGAAFHVVAGCFQIEANAQKFVELLQQQNISSSIIGQNNNGLYVVSCGDFDSRKDALQALESLRASQPNAWLYRN
jgi:hypothetical protein